MNKVQSTCIMDDFSLEFINYLGTKGLILFQFSYYYSDNTKQ